MNGGFVDHTISVFGNQLFVPASVGQILLSILFGLTIGIERELRGKPASLRTFTVISAGSCLFTLMSVRATGVDMSHDVTRIASNIVSGVGFLGGGVIFKTTDRIEGITTGALIWFVAAVGMTCGFNAINEACWAFFLIIVTYFVIAILYRLLFLLKRSRLKGFVAKVPRSLED